MAWQQPGFKSNPKLLAQDKNLQYVKKENNKPWNTKRRAEKRVMPGDDSGIFQKFE